MPRVVESNGALFRGSGEVVGVAQGRGLVKVSQLPQLAIIDSETLVNGSKLGSQSAEGVLNGLVGKVVDVEAGYMDGGWVCKVINEGGRSDPPKAPEEPTKSTKTEKVDVETSGSRPTRATTEPTSLTLPPMRPLGARLPFSQLESGVGVVTVSYRTYGYLRSLAHNRVFFPGCNIRSRYARRFIPNYRPGTVVEYSAEPDNRSRTSPPGMIARRVRVVPLHNFEPGAVVVGYGEIVELQAYFGFLRTPDLEHRVFFPRTNVVQLHGGTVPMRVNARCFLGETVRFVAFHAGENRAPNLGTPYVALFVQLSRLDVRRPLGYPQGPRSRPYSTSSYNSDTYNREHSVRRAQSMGNLGNDEPFGNDSFVTRRSSFASEFDLVSRSTPPSRSESTDEKRFWCGSESEYEDESLELPRLGTNGGVGDRTSTASYGGIGTLAPCLVPTPVSQGTQSAVQPPALAQQDLANFFPTQGLDLIGPDTIGLDLIDPSSLGHSDPIGSQSEGRSVPTPPPAELAPVPARENSTTDDDTHEVATANLIGLDLM